jgi:hypothetical protein
MAKCKHIKDDGNNYDSDFCPYCEIERLKEENRMLKEQVNRK